MRVSGSSREEKALKPRDRRRTSVMDGQFGTEEMSHELRVFLSEVGELVREYLETKHRRRRTIRPTLVRGSGNEGRRILPRK